MTCFESLSVRCMLLNWLFSLQRVKAYGCSRLQSLDARVPVKYDLWRRHHSMQYRPWDLTATMLSLSSGRLESLPICPLVLTSALESSATCTDNTHAFLINQAWVALYDSYSICIAHTPACTTLGAGRPLLRPVSVWELMMSFIVHTFSCSKTPVGTPEEEGNIA